MKLSKREKVLVILLAFFLVGIAYYKFVFAGQREKLESLKSEKEGLTTTYTEMNRIINSIDDNKSSIKIFKESIEAKSMELYPAIYQERIIIEINKIMDEANIKGSIGFSEVTTSTVQKYFPEAQGEVEQVIVPSLKEAADEIKGLEGENAEVEEEKAESQLEGIDAENIFVEQLQTTVTFIGTYENATKFIKLISDYARLITVPNIALTTTGQDQVTGTITLEFYSIPKFMDEDGEYLQWNYNGAYGKSNPFLADSSIVTSVEGEKEGSYHLAMSINGSDSDLPNMALGKANDSTRNTYVYYNKNEKVDVEIEITEENGRYYVKYKTPQGSYPVNYSGRGLEVNPGNGKIEIAIFSTSRTSGDDKVGVNLKVTSDTTSKGTRVTIIDDDKVNPRVNIETIGKVEYIIK